MLRRALQTPIGVRSPTPARMRTTILLAATRKYSSAPSVTQTSFWKSLVPKPWRPKEKRLDANFGPPKTLKKPKKDWNPATFYIVIFLFIGSMSIQMISLKKDFSTHMRRAETKIGILREVVEKLQRGEAVDVEKALGVGDDQQEKEWEDVMREIERDDALRTPKRTGRSRNSSSTTKSESKPEVKAQEDVGTEKPKTSAVGFSGFY